jgi:hypothetical protein
VYAVHLLVKRVKVPSLKLKTWSKQLLGSKPITLIVIVLSVVLSNIIALSCYISHSTVKPIMLNVILLSVVL